MLPKPKPVRGAVSRATKRSRSGDWLVQAQTARPFNIGLTRKTARELGVFDERCERRAKGDASAHMFTEDRVVKKAACHLVLDSEDRR